MRLHRTYSRGITIYHPGYPPPPEGSKIQVGKQIWALFFETSDLAFFPISALSSARLETYFCCV